MSKFFFSPFHLSKSKRKVFIKNNGTKIRLLKRRYLKVLIYKDFIFFVFENVECHNFETIQSDFISLMRLYVSSGTFFLSVFDIYRKYCLYFGVNLWKKSKVTSIFGKWQLSVRKMLRSSFCISVKQLFGFVLNK